MFFKPKTRRALPKLEALTLDRLPVLSADELISLLGLHNRLRNIQRIVGIDQTRFEVLYLAPIRRFIELAQLAPASTDYHHTGPGGLTRHTIGMVELALHERRKVELPLKSDPEIQQQERHSWTYAVFAGALLHDIGKLVTLTRFETGTGWFNPYSESAVSELCSEYSIRFIKSPYSLHQRLSATFFQVLPASGQAFLTSNLAALEQLMGFFNDSPYDWGSVGEIVRLADQTSVANDLRLGRAQRFPNAPSSPLHERLVTALRQVIRNGELPINRPGAALWVKGQDSYLVCKVGADAMRAFLVKHGATDIPADNLRLFDTLQQFGYALSTPEGRAIWKINVVLPNADDKKSFKQNFTVLKFETRRIFHPSSLPEDLQGVVFEGEAGVNDVASLEDADTTTPALPQVLAKSASSKSGAKPEKPNSSVPQEQSLPSLGPNDLSKDDPNAPGLVSQEPCVETGEAFLVWLKERVRARLLNLNEGEIHILNYKDRNNEVRAVAGIVSPSAFKQFAENHGINQGNPYEVVQKSVHKLKKAIKNGKFHIHRYRIVNSPSRNAEITFYLFEVDEVIPQGTNYSVNESLVFKPMPA